MGEVAEETAKAVKSMTFIACDYWHTKSQTAIRHSAGRIGSLLKQYPA
jgi:hypothetical protein